MDALAAAIQRHAAHLRLSGNWARRERTRLEVELEALLTERLVGRFRAIPETTTNLKTTKWGSVIVESEETGLTTREDLYAAGDNVRGADLVVTAVAAARKAALAMHQKLMAMRDKKCRVLGEPGPSTVVLSTE